MEHFRYLLLSFVCYAVYFQFLIQFALNVFIVLTVDSLSTQSVALEPELNYRRSHRTTDKAQRSKHAALIPL